MKPHNDDNNYTKIMYHWQYWKGGTGTSGLPSGLIGHKESSQFLFILGLRYETKSPGEPQGFWTLQPYTSTT